MNDKYLTALRTSAEYDATAKKEFHTAARTLLRRLAKELGDRYGKHDPIRSNQGGIAVSGEVTLHYDHLYIQVSQSCLGGDRTVLFRSCKGRRDYCGGSNNFATSLELCDAAALSTRILAACPPPCA